jgi:DNA polymerase-3 subunit delta
MITRSFLNKSKKILQLSTEFEKNKNIELTISTAKPPIFWKDKEITKKQIHQWKPENIKKLIYRLNELELLIKKNLIISTNLITDFILEQSALKVNS